MGIFSHLFLPNRSPTPTPTDPGFSLAPRFQISLEKEICSEVGGVRRTAGKEQILLPLYFRVLFLCYPHSPLTSSQYHFSLKCHELDAFRPNLRAQA